MGINIKESTINIELCGVIEICVMIKIIEEHLDELIGQKDILAKLERDALNEIIERVMPQIEALVLQGREKEA